MKKLSKNIAFWLFVLFIAVQGFAIISGFLIQHGFANPDSRLLALLLAFGSPLFENWQMFSIIFMAVYIFDIIAKERKGEKGHQSIFINSILLCVNLLFCNQLYRIDSVQEKLTYIKNHLWGFCLFLVVAIVTPIIITTLIRLIRARQAYNDEIEKDDCDRESRINRHTQETEYREKKLFIQHPLLSAWNKYLKYCSEKNEVKYNKKAERLKIKADADLVKYRKKKGEDSNQIIPTIVGLVSILFVIALNIICFVVKINGTSLIEVLHTVIKDFFTNSSEAIGDISNPALNWFQIFGSVFLILFAILLINFFVYFSLRSVLYFLFNTREDAEPFNRIIKKLKYFLFEIANGAVRLLLFFPDFLILLENLVFELDMDEIVDNYFKIQDETEEDQIEKDR